MRRLFFVVCVMLLLLPGQAKAERYMRVVARDDSPAAQREKMMVRNLALVLGPEALRDMRRDVKVEQKRWQPDEKTPPAQTVYITIGPGMGRNWWGVLYPESAAWAASEGTGLLFPFFNWLRELFIPR